MRVVNEDTTINNLQLYKYDDHGLILSKEFYNYTSKYFNTYTFSYLIDSGNAIQIKRTCIDTENVSSKNLSREFYFDTKGQIKSIKRYLKGAEEIRFEYAKNSG